MKPPYNADSIRQHQRQLEQMFRILIAEKKQHEILTFGKPDGSIVEHHPDGSVKVVGYAE